MTYVDGFVLPVKKRQLATYRSMAKRRPARSGAGTAPWNSRECVADDVPPGKTHVISACSVKLQARRDRSCSLTSVYRSRALTATARRSWRRSPMKDKRIDAMMKSKERSPFDGKKRMIVGGFKTIGTARNQ